MTQGQIQMSGCRGTAEARGEGTIEEVTGGHFPEAKKDRSHWGKIP